MEKLRRILQINEETQIDKDMIPILINLNKKGYKTLYCCQGHKKDFMTKKSRIIGYLLFIKNYNFSIPCPILQFKRKGNTLYANYKKSNNSFYFFTSANSDFDKKEKERKMFIQLLLKWSKELPNIK